MCGKKLIEKLRNLTEILLLPDGLRLKLQHRNFHWRDYRLCLRLRASGVAPRSIFDVGANEGQFAIGALATFPAATIWSYEPGAGAFARLGAVLGNHPRMRLARKALGREEGEATLHVTTADQSSSLLELHANHLEAYPEVRELRQETVQVSTLKNEIERILPPEPVLLKIDTQGFEMQVLQGAGEALGRIRWIVLETATRPMYRDETLFSDISRWLGDRGFVFRGPLELHVNPAGRPCQFDVLFERDGGELQT